MDDTVLLHVLQVLGISLIPVALVGAVMQGRRVLDRCLSVARRLDLVPEPPPPPAGPPLERLVADLRRLRPQARVPRPGAAMARRRGILAAYDEVLVAAAAALEVPTTLTGLPDGLDREAERLRLECALEDAGLRW